MLPTVATKVSTAISTGSAAGRRRLGTVRLTYFRFFHVLSVNLARRATASPNVKRLT